MSNGNGVHVEVTGGGVPPVTPNLGLPRYAGTDPADFPTQVNAISDLLDTVVAKRRVAVTAAPILDVGVAGQVRAGRQLTAADFTALGLSAPLGLWNLSDLSDASGNGRALSNKGAVPFGPGINGAASTAAVFAGSTGQALYISDTGAADPFRIKTGSWGCWFRTAKAGAGQYLLSKVSAAAGQRAWSINVDGASNAVQGTFYSDGTSNANALGVSNVCDDRWHFVVVTYDGAALRTIVDGVVEGAWSSGTTPIFGGSAPLNIGGFGADGSTAAGAAHYGRVDEAFVTADVLSPDQIRALYCAKIAHGFSATPTAVSLAVRRQRKGAALAVGDFPTPPLRLHNFTAGSLADQGSNGVALTNNGAAVSVAGADGSQGGAFNFVTASSQSLSATDAGLPSGTATRSYGCWVKGGTASVTWGVLTWGTPPGNVDLIYINTGVVTAASVADAITGPFVGDGQWHFVVVVEDNAAGDGVRRKLYVDGLLGGGSTSMGGSLILGGANRFRIGATADGSSPFTGQIDGAFVCDYALTQQAISTLYAKGSMALAPSPKNAGDHVEYADATNIFAVFDTLDTQHQIDLGVSA
jgi:Concanavalin A-like lectin/glucanases superfamily